MGRARVEFHKETDSQLELVIGDPVNRPVKYKPFIAWDGEGITPPKPEYPPFDWDPWEGRITDGWDWVQGWKDTGYYRRFPLRVSDRRIAGLAKRLKYEIYKGRYSIANLELPQDYVLFGASTGEKVIRPSLSTVECFDLLLEVESKYPDAIHVGFGLRYDVNMILKDLPLWNLKQIFRKGRTKWNGYYIEYRPGKWLTVNRRKVDGPDSPTIKLFDIFGFFQSSFVKACEDLLGKDHQELIAIREGKAARQEFTYDQVDSFVLPYMEGELRMMVKLMDALRDSLHSASLDLQSWHGAGAVASHILAEHKIRDYMAECPDAVTDAARYAYAGGRFELFQCGYHHGKVYEYDIRSAYPSVMPTLPNLTKGAWRRACAFEPGTFGIWNVEYHADKAVGIRPAMPLFRRHKQGMVSYPDNVRGWYWTPEVELIPPECVQYGYVFEEDDATDRPYSFVPEMYETRRKWKAEGNSAQLAYKLGLNSLYGKMAQRVGGKKSKPPIYHQLEWAGYVTSATRAKIYRAVQLNPDAIIAIETDAVFSTEQLPLTLSSKLGEWEETIFDDIVYLQSGFYYTWRNGEIIEKYRGFDKGSVPVEKVLDHFRLLNEWQDVIHVLPPNCQLSGTTTRFIGFGLALHTSSVWRSWETNKYRGIDIGGNTKRKHTKAVCPQCIDGYGFSECLHRLTINMEGGDSFPHSLPWISGDEPERLPWEERAELTRF